MKPLLEKLLASFGPVTDDEKRLIDLRRILLDDRISVRERKEKLSERAKREAERGERDLTRRLTGDVRFELREVLQKALGKLGNPIGK